jgi:hypothetical protein
MQHHFYYYSNLYLIRFTLSPFELAESFIANQHHQNQLDLTRGNLVRHTLSNNLYLCAKLPSELESIESYLNEFQSNGIKVNREIIQHIWNNDDGRNYLDTCIGLIKESDSWKGSEVNYLNQLFNTDYDINILNI